MGQYHIPVNLFKKEFINPHRLGNGLKIVEQCWASGGAGVGPALIILLGVSARGGGRGGGDPRVDDPNGIVGRWGGDRIAIVGDYATREDLEEQFHADLIYSLCDDPDSVAETVAHLAKGEYEGHAEKAERMGVLTPYTDISDMVCDFIEREFEGKFVGDGWRDFVHVEQTVYRWTDAAREKGEPEQGKVVSVDADSYTIQWPGSKPTYGVRDKKKDWFS